MKKCLITLFIFIISINNIKAISFDAQIDDDTLAREVACAIGHCNPSLDITNDDINNLKVLDLIVEGINNFNGLEIFNKLEYLDLSGNQIEEIPDGFANTTFNNLIELKLEVNNISVIPNALFDHLPNLEVLALDQNNINTIPNNIYKLDNLSSINLSNNNISILPVEFKQLSLENIKISQNKLSNINNIKYSDKLIYLGAGVNSITSIPDEIKNAINLEQLYLQDNEIEYINDNLFTLSKLTDINIGRNNIKKLPNNFVDFPSNVDNLEFEMDKCNLLYLSIEQYEFIKSFDDYDIRKQKADVFLEEGYILDDYIIDQFSIFKIISISNGDVSFELYDSNNELISEPLERIGNDITLIDGIITIGSDLFNNIGNYKLIAYVDSRDFRGSTYTFNFNITNVKKISPSIDDTNDTIISDNKDIPITGYCNPLTISITLSILSIITYLLRKKNEYYEK